MDKARFSASDAGAQPNPALPLLAIVGPTGAGKSALALHLAQRFDGKIINADSRQVYRGMEIGTAQPSAQDRARAPHHLFGFLESDQAFSLALFLRLGQEAIAGVHGSGGLPILVGGTGQYAWALLEGWQTPRVPPNPELRRGLEEEAQRLGPEALHQRLRQADPQAAARVDPRNVRRVVRALEVAAALGTVPRPRRKPPPYRSLALGLTTTTRAELYRRLDQRVEAMLAAGWLGEVRALLERGSPEKLPAFASAGYRELALHLSGQLSLAEAVQRVKMAHHRLARRQYAWFKPADPRIRWIVAGEAAHAQAEAPVRDLLR
jgi:tRNA dimethylallyltransferase